MVIAPMEVKMKLQQQLKSDLTLAMKAKNDMGKDTLRVILGEFARQGKKELTDDEVIKILQKLVKSEKELLEKKGATEDSAFIRIIEQYLPQLATEEEIIEWVHHHLDLSEFNNKLQAMRPIMTHFGPRADGNTVKKILQNI
jgi:uncharacterized protein YqeY